MTASSLNSVGSVSVEAGMFIILLNGLRWHSLSFQHNGARRSANSICLWAILHNDNILWCLGCAQVTKTLRLSLHFQKLTIPNFFPLWAIEKEGETHTLNSKHKPIEKTLIVEFICYKKGRNQSFNCFRENLKRCFLKHCLGQILCKIFTHAHTQTQHTHTCTHTHTNVIQHSN